jgi:hypothetical protein
MGHDDPRVAPLIRARAEAESLGDLEFAGELDAKVRAVAPEFAHRIEGVDAGAGRGRRNEMPRDPTQHMNALLRAGAHYKRERLAQLVDEEFPG